MLPVLKQQRKKSNKKKNSTTEKKASTERMKMKSESKATKKESGSPRRADKKSKRTPLNNTYPITSSEVNHEITVSSHQNLPPSENPINTPKDVPSIPPPNDVPLVSPNDVPPFSPPNDVEAVPPPNDNSSVPATNDISPIPPNDELPIPPPNDNPSIPPPNDNPSIPAPRDIPPPTTIPPPDDIPVSPGNSFIQNNFLPPYDVPPNEINILNRSVLSYSKEKIHTSHIPPPTDIPPTSRNDNLKAKSKSDGTIIQFQSNHNGFLRKQEFLSSFNRSETVEKPPRRYEADYPSKKITTDPSILKAKKNRVPNLLSFSHDGKAKGPKIKSVREKKK
jgi:hypothetical protein